MKMLVFVVTQKWSIYILLNFHKKIVHMLYKLIVIKVYLLIASYNNNVCSKNVPLKFCGITVHNRWSVVNFGEMCEEVMGSKQEL